MHLGFMELAVVLAIVALVVGPNQIPKLAKSLSEAMRYFRQSLPLDQESDDAHEPE